jgi:hypothetical protein
LKDSWLQLQIKNLTSVRKIHFQVFSSTKFSTVRKIKNNYKTNFIRRKSKKRSKPERIIHVMIMMSNHHKIIMKKKNMKILAKVRKKTLAPGKPSNSMLCLKTFKMLLITLN